MTPTLSIGITTRDRPASLAAGLDSLRLLADLSPQVVVFDDGSRETIDALAAAAPLSVTVIRAPDSPGTIFGRNRLVEAARSEFVLLLDDDARLLDAESIWHGLRVIQGDPTVGAVAFAQAEADGRPWPDRMQPSRATAPAIVPTFIGFAHLLRRSVFLQLGGYREALQFYGEEKEYGVRLMDAGYKTVYLPDARVAHVIDPASRNAQRHLRMVARNDCLTSLYNDPIERAIWMVPARFCLYFRMRHGWKISDPGGGWWLFRDLAARLPGVVRDRRPVSRRTIARWRDLNTSDVPYERPHLPKAESRVG